MIALFAEIGGGAFLLIGLQTRFIVILLAIFTIATAIFFHTNFADQNTMFNFLKNIMITGELLQILAFSAPLWSVGRRAAV